MDRSHALHCVSVPDSLTDEAAYCSAFVDTLVNLGLLKVDKEPIVLCGEDRDWNWWLEQPPAFKGAAVKYIIATNFKMGASAMERAVKEMFASPYSVGGMITPRHAIEAIERAGLKIVEAGS